MGAPMEYLNLGCDLFGNIDSHNHARPNFASQRATCVARREQFGWYVAPSGAKWAIGEMQLSAPFERRPLLNNDQEPVVFGSVERALQFLREEYAIFSVAVYQC